MVDADEQTATDPPCMYCDGHGVTGPLDEAGSPAECAVCEGSGIEPSLHSLLAELVAVSDSWLRTDYDSDVVDDIRGIVKRYRTLNSRSQVTEERERIAKSLHGILPESMCNDIASGVFGRTGKNQ